MAHGERVHAYERGICRVQHVPLNREAPDRVRPIQHHEGDLLLAGRLHRERHGGDIRVVAGADVLDIEQQDLDSLQH